MLACFFVTVDKNEEDWMSNGAAAGGASELAIFLNFPDHFFD